MLHTSRTMLTTLCSLGWHKNMKILINVCVDWLIFDWLVDWLCHMGVPKIYGPRMSNDHLYHWCYALSLFLCNPWFSPNYCLFSLFLDLSKPSRFFESSVGSSLAFLEASTNLDLPHDIPDKHYVYSWSFAEIFPVTKDSAEIGSPFQKLSSFQEWRSSWRRCFSSLLGSHIYNLHMHDTQGKAFLIKLYLPYHQPRNCCHQNELWGYFQIGDPVSQKHSYSWLVWSWNIYSLDPPSKQQNPKLLHYSQAWISSLCNPCNFWCFLFACFLLTCSRRVLNASKTESAWHSFLWLPHLLPIKLYWW